MSVTYLWSVRLSAAGYKIYEVTRYFAVRNDRSHKALMKKVDDYIRQKSMTDAKLLGVKFLGELEV
jgi:hypothetical protein